MTTVRDIRSLLNQAPAKVKALLKGNSEKLKTKPEMVWEYFWQWSFADVFRIDTMNSEEFMSFFIQEKGIDRPCLGLLEQAELAEKISELFKGFREDFFLHIFNHRYSKIESYFDRSPKRKLNV